MSEAEEILARLESKGRSFRGAFCLALAGLATLVAAYASRGFPDVIRTKAMNVLAGDGKGVAGAVAAVNHRIAFGTVKGSNTLISIGEGSTGEGVIVLSGAGGKDVVRLSTVKNGGGSIGINGPDGVEIANASPNITSAGSLFIDNAAGSLISEINGDKLNGGVIAVRDAQGKETARVHQ
ncbi:MAG: hypothetical protein ACHQ50_04295 [Fimbriimonadales bacterium]